MRPKAVILNDASTRRLHGDARVMRLLVAGLEGAGIEVAARSPARADWAADRTFLAALANAQVVVINGEGTLRDGAQAGARLLSVLDHPLAQAKPVALVNALWDGNPPAWNRWLGQLALAAARDGGSAVAMTLGGARRVRWLPDLSLAAPAEAHQAPREGLIVGDSARWPARQALARAAQRLGARYVPSKTLPGRAWRLPPPGRTLAWRGYAGLWSGRVPPIDAARDESSYLAVLARAEGHLTGRFHAVCLSFLTGTPVRALASRASEVERLLHDAGLGADRLLTAEALAQITPEEAREPWRVEERVAIDAYLERGREEAARLFADVRALCS